MGAELELEVDTGEIYKIYRPDGVPVGKAIYAFATIYGAYEELFEVDTREYLWFRKLEDLIGGKPKLIGEMMYAGNWDYGERDYEQFHRCEPMYAKVSEEEFLRALTQLNNMWTPIEAVISVVKDLLRVLPEMGESTDWFSPEDTVEGFEALLETLKLAKSRYGEEVRLKGY